MTAVNYIPSGLLSGATASANNKKSFNVNCGGKLW